MRFTHIDINLDTTYEGNFEGFWLAWLSLAYLNYFLGGLSLHLRCLHFRWSKLTKKSFKYHSKLMIEFTSLLLKWENQEVKLSSLNSVNFKMVFG